MSTTYWAKDAASQCELIRILPEIFDLQEQLIDLEKTYKATKDENLQTKFEEVRLRYNELAQLANSCLD